MNSAECPAGVVPVVCMQDNFSCREGLLNMIRVVILFQKYKFNTIEIFATPCISEIMERRTKEGVDCKFNEGAISVPQKSTVIMRKKYIYSTLIILTKSYLLFALIVIYIIPK